MKRRFFSWYRRCVVMVASLPTVTDRNVQEREDERVAENDSIKGATKNCGIIAR